MELGNIILFWVLGGFALMLINFLLFRFSLIRKLVYIGFSITLIACGFNLGNLVSENMTSYSNVMNILIDNQGGYNIMFILSMTSLGMVFLMMFGDSLMDFESVSEYSIDGFSVLGLSFITVSEENVETPSFIIFYAIATALALAVHFICFLWWGWHYIFGIAGCISLGYVVVIKPVILAFSS